MSIKSFRHNCLKRLFTHGTSRGISPDMTKRLLARLEALDTARELADLNIKSYRLHQWKGDRTIWSIDVSGAWRILFRWDEEGRFAYDVDLEQPH
jgi:toxin HigB-1